MSKQQLNITNIGGSTALITSHERRFLTDPTFDPGGEDPAPAPALGFLVRKAEKTHGSGHRIQNKVVAPTSKPSKPSFPASPSSPSPPPPTSAPPT